MGRLEGKVAVITGGASGIGEGIVRRFVEEGARVVVADIQREEGHAVADELGPAAVFHPTDVSVEADVAAAVDLAVSSFGRLDVMCNNAGIVGAIGPIEATAEAAFDRTVDVLLKGVFFGMKHAARVMVPQGSGAIVSTASTAAVVGGLGPHLYTMCKHGVVGLTRSVANELGPEGIRVNAVAPGSTVSAMTADVVTGDHTAEDAVGAHIAERSLLGFAAVPDDIASAVLYLASDEARYVSGHCLVVDGGQTASGTVVNRIHAAESTTMIQAGGRD